MWRTLLLQGILSLSPCDKLFPQQDYNLMLWFILALLRIVCSTPHSLAFWREWLIFQRWIRLSPLSVTSRCRDLGLSKSQNYSFIMASTFSAWELAFNLGFWKIRRNLRDDYDRIFSSVLKSFLLLSWPLIQLKAPGESLRRCGDPRGGDHAFSSSIHMKLYSTFLHFI